MARPTSSGRARMLVTSTHGLWTARRYRAAAALWPKGYRISGRSGPLPTTTATARATSTCKTSLPARYTSG
ncbi:hypothetical protein MBAV_003623 [Candidatus Magnetobacterium bavaricum]|uniref:Uncharacterized protein n=1 Tax=Candidatus Magnetobacterium bavaricum TaxID=29290 RepID=A0A0F3GQR9_9BACT|nr:hypothetical protein MBAV_003623 [Candidatus Magnetobacterium bavaricum]